MHMMGTSFQVEPSAGPGALGRAWDGVLGEPSPGGEVCECVGGGGRVVARALFVVCLCVLCCVPDALQGREGKGTYSAQTNKQTNKHFGSKLGYHTHSVLKFRM